MNVRLYTDGGARGNPGPAGAGFVIYSVNEQGEQADRLFEGCEYMGKATNNQAEYHAILIGLQKAAELGAGSVDTVLDSELAVKQLNREYRVKNEELAKKFLAIHNLLHHFDSVTFRHVRREFNKEADAMVNKAIDEALGVV